MTTVNILGVKLQTTKKILRAPKSEVVLAYTKAVNEGRSQAKKLLKNLELQTK